MKWEDDLVLHRDNYTDVLHFLLFFFTKELHMVNTEERQYSPFETNKLIYTEHFT